MAFGIQRETVATPFGKVEKQMLLSGDQFLARFGSKSRYFGTLAGATRWLKAQAAKSAAGKVAS